MKQSRQFFGIALAAIFAACFLSSCEFVKGFFSSPSSTVKKYWKAMEEYDKTVIKKCLSDDIEGGFSTEEFKQLKKAKVKFSLKKIEDEDVNEEEAEATLECLVEISVKNKKKGKGIFTVNLAKEDGDWLITSIEPDEDIMNVLMDLEL